MGKSSFLLVALLASTITLHAADFHVAPAGSDTNPGTVEKPFATLVRARDAVRAELKKDADRDFTVQLAGGTYRLSETLVFGLEDSAHTGRTITYAAVPGEKPVLSGGVAVDGWKLLTEFPQSLPEAARGKVWAAPLPEGMEDVNMLSDDMGLLTRAMSRVLIPDEKRQPPLRVDRDWADPTIEQRTRLGLRPDQIKDWSYLAQMELRILPRHEFCEMLPLAACEKETNTLVTAVPCAVMLYPAKGKKVDFGHGPESASAFLENSPEFIDVPGEWSLDLPNRRILLWPRDDAEPRNIVLGNLTELVRVEGEVREAEPTDLPANGIVFEGLTFAHTSRLTTPVDYRDWCIQNGWDLYDRPTHALRLRSAGDCVVRACEFRHLGGGAVRVDLHSQRNRIEGNWLHDIGGSGILLQGYGLGTKDVNRENIVENNLVERIGRIEWDALGIFVWQSGGNRIAHNHVRDTNYTGIGVSGEGPWEIQKRLWPDGKKHWRWTEIRAFLADKAYAAEFARLCAQLDALGGGKPQIPRNDDGSLAVAVWYHGHFLHSRDNHLYRNRVENVARICGDANAIYIGGGAGTGNRVEENYCNESPEAIRCDDDVQGTVVIGNVLGEKASPFVSKGFNTFENNIVLSAGPGRLIRFTAIHPNCMFGTLHVEKSVLRRNLLAQSKGPLPESLVMASDGNLDLLKKLPPEATEKNAVWASGATGSESVSLFPAALGHPATVLVGDPMFRDAANLDFRTGENSPLRAIGIEGINAQDIGLKSSFAFPSANQ